MHNEKKKKGQEECVREELGQSYRRPRLHIQRGQEIVKASRMEALKDQGLPQVEQKRLGRTRGQGVGDQGLSSGSF